jgi:DNA-binding transcriptional LysR family regulator
MHRDDLSSLAIFVEVAEARSFTRAAAKLGTSQSAISHAMRRLEAKLGIRLLTRTTRSVAPTQAGERLIATLRPAFREIDEKLAALSDLRDRPAGSIRISTPELAARTVLWPVVERLTAHYPDIQVELNVESGLTDIVAERYDAGVRLGERLEADMIAVRIGPKLRMVAVGAPSYFAHHGVPLVPGDLAGHNCINLRMASGNLYTWEFTKDGHDVNVKVEGQLVFNRVDLILAAAAAGRGLAFIGEEHSAALVANGSLVRVLEDWSEPFDGFYLYYPSRRQPSQAFSLLLEALWYRD